MPGVSDLGKSTKSSVTLLVILLDLLDSVLRPLSFCYEHIALTFLM